jgi:arsenate reductase
MAEAILRHLAGSRFAALSAGVVSRPIHPLVLRVLEEAGMDGSGLASKSVSRFLARTRIHVAVLLQGGAASPRIYPFAPRTLVWPVAAPAAGLDEADLLLAFREVRDRLTERIRDLVVELGSPAVPEETAAGVPAATG